MQRRLEIRHGVGSEYRSFALEGESPRFDQNWPTTAAPAPTGTNLTRHDVFAAFDDEVRQPSTKSGMPIALLAKPPNASPTANSNIAACPAAPKKQLEPQLKLAPTKNSDPVKDKAPSPMKTLPTTASGTLWWERVGAGQLGNVGSASATANRGTVLARVIVNKHVVIE